MHDPKPSLAAKTKPLRVWRKHVPLSQDVLGSESDTGDDKVAKSTRSRPKSDLPKAVMRRSGPLPPDSVHSFRQGSSWERRSKKVIPSVDIIFEDFKGRRAGILDALASKAEKFRDECEGSTGSDIRLLALPDGSWKVAPLQDDVIQGHEGPHTLGIKVARDHEVTLSDWFDLVVQRSESWLLEVAGYFGAQLSKAKQYDLLYKINDLPSVIYLFPTTVKKAPKQPELESRSKACANVGTETLFMVPRKPRTASRKRKADQVLEQDGEQRKQSTE